MKFIASAGENSRGGQERQYTEDETWEIRKCVAIEGLGGTGNSGEVLAGEPANRILRSDGVFRVPLARRYPEL
jgi:predicted ATPase